MSRLKQAKIDPDFLHNAVQLCKLEVGNEVRYFHNQSVFMLHQCKLLIGKNFVFKVLSCPLLQDKIIRLIIDLISLVNPIILMVSKIT